jgi:alpha-glucosidase
MLATLEFWLNRGVDGFRLDAVNTLFEDVEFRDNPPLAAPRVTLTGVYTQDFVYTRRLPEVHAVLRRLRAFTDQRAPGAVLISEAYVDAVTDLVQFYGDADDEMHLPFNFFLAQVSRARLRHSGRRLKTWRMPAAIGGRARVEQPRHCPRLRSLR